MIEDIFCVIKDLKSGMYIGLVPDSKYYSSGGASLVLTDKFKDAYRFDGYTDTSVDSILRYKSEYSPNGVDIWDSWHLMVGGDRNKRTVGEMELVVEWYAVTTKFVKQDVWK